MLIIHSIYIELKNLKQLVPNLYYEGANIKKLTATNEFNRTRNSFIKKHSDVKRLIRLVWSVNFLEPLCVQLRNK